ncbi:glycosyltransferase [Planctomycetota bacterium]|nr:glycosyltransferase [Planctomycetota bacterium]
MRIGVLTSLYPCPERPFEGIFAERKWLGLRARGHHVTLAHPVPWGPRWLAPLLGDGRAYLARIPRTEDRGGIQVRRPRFGHLPGRAAGNAARFAAAGARALMGAGAAAPEVVVCDYAWPAAAAVGVFRRAGVPVLVNGRGSDVLQVRDVPGLKGALAGGLADANGYTAVSQDLLDAMVGLGGTKPIEALTPNGVDAAHFSPGSRSAARARLQQEREGDLVLCVGHLIERKDPLLALRAFAAGAPESARLVFVGRGPLAEAVAGAARELGVGQRVSLLGERPPEELVDWYRAADMLLLTSHREGRPNVVLEALSAGCPVLATRAGGTGELVSDPRMLSGERTPEALGGMLAALLSSPPGPEELRQSVRHLTWGASLDALEGVLGEAAGS